MSRFDYSRPKFRTAGRVLESMSGQTSGVSAAPKKPATAKADLRADAADALAEFMARGGKITRGPSPAEHSSAPTPARDRKKRKPKAIDVLPPWE